MNSLAGLGVRRIGESQKKYAARLKAEQANRTAAAAREADKERAALEALRVVRRTFEAKKHPPGSAERAKLNESAITSEYLPSYRYLVVSAAIAANYGPTCGAKQFRTKREAEQFLEGQ